MITIQNVNYLTLDDFAGMVHTIQKQKHLFVFLEDIPPFETRYEGVLESIVEQIKAVCFGVELYPDLISKASWLFYALIKNHPFQNGNKRVGVIALVTFLALNSTDNENVKTKPEMKNVIYELALFVAESKAEDKDVVFEEIKSRLSELACFMTKKNKWFWII